MKLSECVRLAEAAIEREWPDNICRPYRGVVALRTEPGKAIDLTELLEDAFLAVFPELKESR